MQNTFLDFVTLLESPTSQSPFYVVESDSGKHYVSAYGGRAAKGLRAGVRLKLYRGVSTYVTAYVLERT